MSDLLDGPNGWVKAYHPSGLLVTLPVPTAHDVAIDYAVAFAAVTAALEAGWLAQAPGLEAGEVVEEVGWVSRSTHEGRTGLADVIAYYSTNENWTKPFLTDYLNTADDRAEFLAATSVWPADIPEYIGEGRLERGKNPRTDALIRKLPRPRKLVMKPNPKWSQTESDAAKAANKVYKVPKRVFVRWDGQQPAPQGGSNVAPPPQASGGRKQETVQWFRDRLTQGPTLAAFNEMMATFPTEGPDRKAVWELCTDHAEQVGWELNEKTRQWQFKQSRPDDGSIPF